MEATASVTDENATDADPRVGLSSAQVAALTAAGQTNAFTGDSSRSAWNIVRARVRR
jgi:cation-transporting ATPase E